MEEPGPHAVRGPREKEGDRERKKRGGKKLSNIINLHSLHLQWPMQGPCAAHGCTMGMRTREITCLLQRQRRSRLKCFRWRFKIKLAWADFYLKKEKRKVRQSCHQIKMMIKKANNGDDYWYLPFKQLIMQLLQHLCRRCSLPTINMQSFTPVQQAARRLRENTPL